MKQKYDFYDIPDNILAIIESDIIDNPVISVKNAFMLGFKRFSHAFPFVDKSDSPKTLYYSHRIASKILSRVEYWLSNNQFFLNKNSTSLPRMEMVNDDISIQDRELVFYHIYPERIEFYKNAIASYLIHISNKLKHSLTEGAIMSSCWYIQMRCSCKEQMDEKEILKAITETYFRG